MSFIIIDAIQHLFWYSWVLYFISVFIIICGWGPSVAHAFAIAIAPSVSFPLSAPALVLFFYRASRRLLAAFVAVVFVVKNNANDAGNFLLSC